MGPPKTANFERLVVHAIKRLQDIQGSTSKEISNYLSQEYDVPSGEIKKQVHLALRRGIDYGLLQRQKGGTYVCSKDDNRECSTAFQKLRAFRRGRGKKRMGRRKSRRRGSRRRKSRGRGRRRRKRAGRGKSRKGRGRRRRRGSGRSRSRGKR